MSTKDIANNFMKILKEDKEKKNFYTIAKKYGFIEEKEEKEELEDIPA